MNNNAFTRPSSLFVSGLPVIGQNIFSPKAKLLKQKAVEAPGRDAETPADAGERNGRVGPDLFVVHQVGEGRKNGCRSIHLNSIFVTNVNTEVHKYKASEKTSGIRPKKCMFFLSFIAFF